MGSVLLLYILRYYLRLLNPIVNFYSLTVYEAGLFVCKLLCWNLCFIEDQRSTILLHETHPLLILQHQA